MEVTESEKARKKREKWPLVVNVDSVRVLIYRTGERHFTAAWRQAGQRKRLVRATLEEATDAAKQRAREISAGKAGLADFRGTDRERYSIAVEAVRPTGIPLEVASQEYAEAWKLVQPASLIQVARWWKEKHSQELPSKPVPELVEEILRDRAEAGLADVYLRSLGYKLRWFAERFPAPIQGITAQMIEEALGRIKRLRPKTWNNYRTDILTLFHYARMRGYLPRDREVEAALVKRVKDPGKRIRVFSPAEMSRLLQAASCGVASRRGRPAIAPRPDLVPFIAIGGFAGVRPMEIGRLEWGDIQWKRGVIEVAKHKAKTASRRLIPIQPNLAEWLAPFRAERGHICTTRTWRCVTALAKAIGLEWPHDVLRDSFISYRTAVTQNLSQVALEAGNSERIIRHSYLELRTPEEGKAWFSVGPAGGVANIVRMEVTA